MEIYNIPQLIGSNRTNVTELIGFNFAKTTKDTANKGLHFFIDDYQFNRLWNNPQAYISLLQRFDFVLSPDFSLYKDYPVALQIYNHYRKHWLAAYWENNGIEVIPTICWSDRASFEWCFDGEPVGGTVAVSSIGTQKSKAAKKSFAEGYNEMINKLKPQTIIFYGNVPDGCSGNIVRIEEFHSKFNKQKGADYEQNCQG